MTSRTFTHTFGSQPDPAAGAQGSRKKVFKYNCSVLSGGTTELAAKRRPSSATWAGLQDRFATTFVVDISEQILIKNIRRKEEQVGAVAGADAIVAAGGSDHRNRGVAHSGKKCTLGSWAFEEFGRSLPEFGRSLVGVWSEFATMCTRSSACEQPLDRNICCRHSIKSVRCQDCTESSNVSE